MAVRPNTTRRRIRMFAIIWSIITLLMGTSTFIAIYFVYGVINTPRNGVTDTGSVALPTVTQSTQAAAAASTVTTIPTNPPTQAPTATEAQAVAQEPTDVPEEAEAANVAPTPLPIDNRAFQVGTQVQVSPDLNEDNQELWMTEVRDKLNLGLVQAAGTLGRCRARARPDELGRA